MYTYTPNALAMEMFGLTERSYSGSNLNILLENTLGKENFDKFVLAQDPIYGDVIQNDVFITEPPHHPQRKSIGMVFKGRVIIEPEKAL